MKFRHPAIPLITSDPYFSIWSMSDELNKDNTMHWTGKPHRITGTIYIDDQKYCFMGLDKNSSVLVQQDVQVDAVSTYYTFECDQAVIRVTFTTPLLMDDLLLVSRPVSYMKVDVKITDNRSHSVRIVVTADDEIALNYKGEYRTISEEIEIPGISCARVGSMIQNVLAQAGDDIRINWGYFYLAISDSDGKVSSVTNKGENGLQTNTLVAQSLFEGKNEHSVLFAFAYDDIHSIEYFGDILDAYWKKYDVTIENAIANAFQDYGTIIERCNHFDEELKKSATLSGGHKYAEIVSLAYRQAIASHKLCLDKEGELLFISKECFSNGCAATVDVSLPSAPLFLLYNPELLSGMLRPIFKYANQDEWYHDFAPHDVGTYPILNGQVYGGGTELKDQMPIEECGNMLILMSSHAIASGSVDFALKNWSLLEKWANYLVKHTFDGKSQLCTDDFAGHLAFNVNLALKGIMGVTAFSLLNKIVGNFAAAEQYWETAKEMRDKWLEKAKNPDGTYKLAFDFEDTFSLKYNIVWDTLWQSDLFNKNDFSEELTSYIDIRMNRYGIPLDSRADYSKIDWLFFIAAMYDSKEQFEEITATIWQAYNDSPSRVPLMDWYDTKTAEAIMFRNRTVVGGFFMKLLKESGRCSIHNELSRIMTLKQ